jgi:hypothetical protein
MIAHEAESWEQLQERMLGELRQVWEAAGRMKDGEALEGAVQGWVRTTGAKVMAAITQEAIRHQEQVRLPECCGGAMRLHSYQSRQVTTLLGTVQLRRRYYRCLQCGRSRYPADAWLGWKDGFSFGVEEAVAWECVALPYREAVATLEKLAGVVVSMHAAQEIVARWGKEELALRPYAARVEKDLVIEIDGTTAHLQEGWKEVKVATCFAWDGTAPAAARKPEAVSYVADWRSAEEFKELVDEEALVRGAPRARAQAVIGDGAPWIWELASWLFPRAVQILDWYHLSEHLWTAARVVHGEGTEPTKRLAERWETEVWEGRSEGVEEHLREFVRQGRDDAKETLRRCADYLQTHQHRLRYPLFRAAGWPTGSGVVEGACKQLVGLRFKRKSTRWSRPGARAVLRLRVDRLSNRWPLRINSVRQSLADLPQAA